MVEIEDRQAILDLILTYCRSIDRRDVEGVRGVYAADGVDHHTGFSGSAADFATWASEHTRRFDGTMHIVGNHLAWVEGDRAVAETYGTAVHWGTPADDPTLNFSSGFRYVDRLRREGGRWWIVERTAIREWTRSDAGRRQEAEAPGPRSVEGVDLVMDLVRDLRAPGHHPPGDAS